MESNVGVAESGEVICSGEEREKQTWNENIIYLLLLLYK